MYVVRRAFRNNGKMCVPGDVIDPGTTKFFKSRLSDRVIVEVTEDSFNEWDEYFRVKYGVSIKAPIEEPVKAKPAVKAVAKATIK